MWKKILLAIVSGALPVVEGLEQQGLEALLEKVYEHSHEDHKAIVQSQYIASKRLMVYAEATKTKIDDTLLQGELDALVAQAKKYGIELPTD